MATTKPTAAQIAEAEAAAAAEAAAIAEAEAKAAELAAAAEAAQAAEPVVEGLALVDILHLGAKSGEWVAVPESQVKPLIAAGAFDVNATKPQPEFL